MFVEQLVEITLSVFLAKHLKTLDVFIFQNKCLFLNTCQNRVL